MVPLNYNFIYTRVHVWQHDKYLNDPVTWLHGPRFLMAWDIHVSCNSSCATHGIVTRGIVTHGTGHACNNHEWNTCKHKCAINIRYSSAINLQKQVHSCESCSRTQAKRSTVRSCQIFQPTHYTKMTLIIKKAVTQKLELPR